MNKELIDGLNRRFQAVEKSTFFESQGSALVDYFSYIIKNPLLLTTSKRILDSENVIEGLLPFVMVACKKNNEYSLIQVKKPKIKEILDGIIQDYEKKKGVKLKREDLATLEGNRRQKLEEFQKEKELYDLSVFHNALLDKLTDEKSSEHRWITQNKNGDYLFDGSHVDIKSKKGHYAIIFDVVFSLKPEGGEISYDDIIAGCRERKLKANSRSIQRALSGPKANLYRYVKGIKHSTSHGIPIFRAQQAGKYIEFNNTKK